MREGQVGTERKGAVKSPPRQFQALRSLHAELLQEAVAPSQTCPRRSVVRVFVQAFAVEVAGHRRALRSALALHVVGAQVEFVSARGTGDVVRQDALLALAQPQHQQLHDAAHQAVLNLDQVVAPGPADMRAHQGAGGRVDQFRTDAELVALAQDRARQQHIHVRFLRDAPGVGLALRQARSQQAGADRQRAQSGERRRNRLGEAVAEESDPLVAVHHLKGKRDKPDCPLRRRLRLRLHRSSRRCAGSPGARHRRQKTISLLRNRLNVRAAVFQDLAQE